ncbi:hypothetical protein [Sphingomonas sp. MMS24-J13]|uniref:PP_RS20740 family protein n=1 Tax=Sphingomonas sp. MMS24-J13 TaxID=3238686 RepID=UPI00384C6A24
MNSKETAIVESDEILAEIDISENPPLEFEETDYIDAVFSSDSGTQTVVSAPAIRTTFAPWHHPVKQIVRDYQWADLVKRLLTEARPENRRDRLRYFTLPGADLLDVRVLAESLSAMGTRIEYFGFDSGYEDEDNEGADLTGAYLLAESALRQAGSISDRAEILRDKLEDIALVGSHAAERLRQRGVFDVVNIDACNHLGYKPSGRNASIFEALEKLLAHQLLADEPWLLFLTTRANVTQLGAPAAKLQSAIMKNIETHQEGFAETLADCIGGKLATIATDMSGCWSAQSIDFLKLFCVGLSKYLLQWYHAQTNLPAKVELASVFAYKVSGEEPDMLSMAFRISPKGLAVQAPSAGGATPLPAVELAQAIGMVSKAKRIWNLDEAIANNQEVRADAVSGTERLLASANYDISKWREWLRNLPIRPMELNDAA